MVELRRSATRGQSQGSLQVVLCGALQIVMAGLVCGTLTLAAQSASAKNYNIRSVSVELHPKGDRFFEFTNGVSTRYASMREIGLTETRVVKDLETILSTVLVDPTEGRKISVDATFILSYFWLFGDAGCPPGTKQGPNALCQPPGIIMECAVELKDTETGRVLKLKRSERIIGGAGHPNPQATIPRLYNIALNDLAKWARYRLAR